ncbi:MAG TPA: ATP-binding protein [Terracidiphilus sp.]|jgi:signal transduction histidine kinase|nr:ATP-binding protein [Terracidiphilus sp.]
MHIATGIARRTVVLAWTITLFTLGIFVAVMIPEQKRDLRAELASKASGVAVSLQGEVAEAAISEDYSAVVEHAMEVLNGDSAVDFLIITKDDGLSVIVDRKGWRMEQKIDRYWYPEQRVPSSELGYVPMLNRRVFHYAVPFDYSSIQWGWIHVGLSLNAYDESTREVNFRTGILTVVCVVISLVASVLYAGRFVRPILRLQSVVERVATGDLMARADIQSHDEIEQLAQAFNGMADMILHRDQELSEGKRDLEQRVAERTGELREQIVAKDAALAELAEAQRRLIDLSRISGMAEVATGVLHNVGNVLNSVNVSATIVADHLRASRIGQMSELVGLLEEHRSGLNDFLTHDPRGQRVLPYMGNLSRHLEQEREQMGKEVASLSQHIGHIKEIVSMQQTYARPAGVYEKVPLPDLMEDLQGLSRPGIERHDIQFRIEDDFSAPITTDRHKVLQILLNLVSNAKDAVKVRDASERRITIHIVRVGEERMAIRVTDNGIGILPANRVRIFSHGFTTKADGHGFGLHSSALAAKQLGGSLTVESEGSNRGATFVLELPIDVNATAQGRMSS